MSHATVTPVPKRKRARVRALSADREARGKRFREARESAGLGQEDAAAALKTSQTTIWRWENRGTIPAGDLLDKAAALYDKTPGWLVSGRDENAESNAPMPEALRDFLAGAWPETPLIEDWMVDQMKRARFPANKEPTVETYRRMVLSYVTVTSRHPPGSRSAEHN